MESSPQESVDAKAEFRKPLPDAANRKYRRRSPPANRSSSPPDGLNRDRSSSPVLRKESTKLYDDRHRKDDGRDSGRNYYGRGSDSYKYSDRQSSRSSHSHHRHDNYDRRGKYSDNTERDNSKVSSRYGRDSRGSTYSDMPKRDNEHRSRDYPREYSRDRSKEDRDARYYKTDNAESREKVEDRKSPRSKDEKQSLNSKEAGKSTSEEVNVTDADIDAAKVAAIKAAEVVNRNLVGTGFMTAEQKKKLLWGNKKNTSAVEPAHRWDTPLFDDRERQEKFNKLMGVKGEIKVEQKAELDDAEKHKIQVDLEKQYTAGLRRRDGRTVGLGL